MCTSRGGVISLRHPESGELRLMAEKFAVIDGDGLEALLLHAEPGTHSARALAGLNAATRPAATTRIRDVGRCSPGRGCCRAGRITT